MYYFFQLGKNPALSKAEILAVLQKKQAKFSVVSFSTEILLLDIKDFSLEPNWADILGGSIKTGTVLAQKFSWSKLILAKEKIMSEFSKRQDNRKFNFGFSCYSLDKQVNDKQLSKSRQDIKNLGYALKKELKSQGISSRLVVSKETTLSSVVVQKNLLDRGQEVVFLCDRSGFYLGFTQSVQNFELFNKLDYSRPAVDPKSGMLPPKVANIMLNLAQIDQEAHILDPFCGSGTILSQAVVLGYNNLTGTDILPKAINDTKKNLQWLSGFWNFNFDKIKLQALDVKNLANAYQPETFDAVVTEPYLGMPLKGNERFPVIKEQIQLCENLYLEAFKNFTGILKDAARLAVVFPVFIFKNNKYYLQILEPLKRLGFEISVLDQKTTEYTFRNSLLYARQNQKVAREIFVFIFHKS